MQLLQCQREIYVNIHPSVLGGVQEVCMQLEWREHTLPALFILALIVILKLAHHEGDKAIKSSIKVWINSGIRTGSNVFKCIVLVATSVMSGKSYAYALACEGTNGVKDCMTNIMSGPELMIALSGCKSISDLTPELIAHS